jgi:cob(I)alamin adenosyltransferase
MSVRPGDELGLVQVYTGEGKTRAALGMALRACGHGSRVLMVQFHKTDGTCAENSIGKIRPLCHHYEERVMSRRGADK